MWGWTVDNFQLSETVLKGRTGRGGIRRVGQLRKLRVSRPQASLCAGACVCVCAHHSCGSGLPASRAPAPDRQSLPVRRPGPQLLHVGLHDLASRSPAYPSASRKDVKGKVTFSLPEWWRCNSGSLPHFSFVLRALLTNAPNSCPPERLFSMFNATFGEDQRRAFGDYLELAMQSQYNRRNL